MLSKLCLGYRRQPIKIKELFNGSQTAQIYAFKGELKLHNLKIIYNDNIVKLV